MFINMFPNRIFGFVRADNSDNPLERSNTADLTMSQACESMYIYSSAYA